MKLKGFYWNLKLRPFRFSKYFFRFSEFFNYDEREKFLWKAFDYLRSNRLDGDYIEFGLSEGKTFIASIHISKFMGNNLKEMRFIGFDSFEGLPKPKGIDVNDFEHFKEGDYAFSYENFIKKLKKLKINLSKVILIRGWFDNTLNKKTKDTNKIDKAAFVFIDCDLYESTVPVLKFITPLLQNGTLLAFDDWYCFRGDENKGQQKAVREWLKRNPKFKLIPQLDFHWGGKCFIVRK